MFLRFLKVFRTIFLPELPKILGQGFDDDFLKHESSILFGNGNVHILSWNNNNNENEAGREDCNRTGSLTTWLIRQDLEKAADLENNFRNQDPSKEGSAKF